MKLVFGVGVNDSTTPVKTTITIEGVKVVTLCPYYKTWKNMLKRCYSTVFQSKNKCYVNVLVCSEWLYFSNFRDWMQQQNWEDKQLDKDLLGDGFLYSPATCCFINRRLNNFLSIGRVDKSLPVGVSYDNDTGKFRASITDVHGKFKYLGLFSTITEAHGVWLLAKSECAAILAESESGSIKDALLEKYAENTSYNL